MNRSHVSHHDTSSRAPGWPGTRQVLGVERDPALIAGGRMLLQSLGFDVVIATTLAGAVAACRARRFDLIIIGSGIPAATAEALLRFVGQRGGPLSLRVYEERCNEDNAANLISTLRTALAT